MNYFFKFCVYALLTLVIKAYKNPICRRSMHIWCTDLRRYGSGLSFVMQELMIYSLFIIMDEHWIC